MSLARIAKIAKAEKRDRIQEKRISLTFSDLGDLGDLVWSPRRWSRLFSAGVKGRCGVHLVDSEATQTPLRHPSSTSAPSMRNLATEVLRSPI
jgi:hypothetical protein